MANDYVGWGLILGIEDSLDDFINDATEVVNSLGTGLPPRDLAAFSSQSTEDGIKLTFTPPAQTYIDDGGTDQFAVMPAGVLIRYSDTGYPRTPDEGKFGYDYKPTGDWVTTSQECTIVGLTKDTKYYFTAFPYSTEHVYNKNQVTANRTEMTWVGNKGTISVTVQTPEDYEGTLGEYTITLVDQAETSPQNEQKTVSGAGLTQFGGLTAGKSYKVRLSNTDDLQAPPDSEAITIVGGVNYDVTMTYALMYGTITVNVSTQPAGMLIGSYTVTLTPQGGGDAMQQSGNNSQAVVFSNVKNGVVYTVGLSAINHYTANAGGTVTAVGGQNVTHNVTYSFTATLNSLSWSEIKDISASGNAPKVFNVGDMKDNVQVNVKHLKPSYALDSSENKSMSVVLVGFYQNYPIFMTYGMAIYYSNGMSENEESFFTTYTGYIKVRDYIIANESSFIPEAYPYMKSYTYRTSSIGYPINPNPGSFTSGEFSSTSKLFIYSGYDPNSYFINNERRKLGTTNTKWKKRDATGIEYETNSSGTSTRKGLFYDSVATSGKNINFASTGFDLANERIPLDSTESLPSPLSFIIG